MDDSAEKTLSSGVTTDQSAGADSVAAATPVAPATPATRGPALTAYPLIALTGTALFPNATLSLTITRPSALRAIRAAHATEKQCVVAFLRSVDAQPGASPASDTAPSATKGETSASATPEASSATLGELDTPVEATAAEGNTSARPGPLVVNGQILCDIATLATIKRFEEQADECVEVLIEGVRRVRVEDWHKESPYPRIAVSQVTDEAPAETDASTMTRALVRHAHALFDQLAQLSRRYAPGDTAVIKTTQPPGRLADLLAAQLAPEAPQQWELLLTLDPLARLESVCVTMGNEIETLELENKIRQKVRQQVEK